MEMMALLDGRMRREATVAGEPALEITILADLSKLPTTSPWLSDWLSAAWGPGNLCDRCICFASENWSRRVGSNHRPADYESTLRVCKARELRRSFARAGSVTSLVGVLRVGD